MKLFFSLLLVMAIQSVYSQSISFDKELAKNIRKNNLRKHILVLASDSLAGRKTGEEGQKKAAVYISYNFRQNGILPINDSGYFQPVPLYRWHWDSCYIEHKGKKLHNSCDMQYLSTCPIDNEIEGNCVFIGDGKNIGNPNLENKIVFAFLSNLRTWHLLSEKLETQKALALFIANPNNKKQFKTIKDWYAQLNQGNTVIFEHPCFSTTEIKAFAVEPEIAETFFSLPVDSLAQINQPNILEKLPSARIKFKCPVIVEKFFSDNVIGYIKGTAPNNESIIVTAHYDHIGMKNGVLHPGADDNASGTSAMLEISKAFSLLHEKPYRNIIFMATTAEEEGLFGAEYFADHQNEYPFNIKANINIDMIGRQDSAHKKNYIYLIGTNEYPEFDSICTIANSFNKPLILDYGYDNVKGPGNMLNLSDHYVFHKQGIPVIAFFSGLHKDYHKPGDTPDKIDYSLLEKRSQLIFNTIYLASQKTVFNH